MVSKTRRILALSSLPWGGGLDHNNPAAETVLGRRGVPGAFALARESRRGFSGAVMLEDELGRVTRS